MGIKAIDFMYYVATQEFMQNWNKWMYMDTQLEDVLQYTKKYPDRFVGLAGYNPFRIKESLRRSEAQAPARERNSAV